MPSSVYDFVLMWCLNDWPEKHYFGRKYVVLPPKIGSVVENLVAGGFVKNEYIFINSNMQVETVMV